MKRNAILVAVVCATALGAVGAGVALGQRGSGPVAPVAEAAELVPTTGALVNDIDLSQVPESLLPLVEAWKERGIGILSLTVDKDDPTKVAVKVPEASLRGPNSMPTVAELERRPALLRANGINVKWLDIYMVADDDTETLYTGFLVDDLLPKSSWSEDSDLSAEAADRVVQSSVEDVASITGITNSHSVFEVTQDGRAATVTAIVEVGGSPNQGAFVDRVHGAVSALNRDQKAAIAFLTIDIVDSKGRLLVREFDDFVVANGGVRSVWVADQFKEMTGYTPDFY